MISSSANNTGNQGPGLRDEEIAERLARLETKIEDLEKMIEDIDKRLDQLDKRLTQVSGNHVSIKYFITLLVILLSFIAAMLGIGWHPP